MSVRAVSERRSNLGEGPHWDSASNSLLHVDAHAGDVCRLHAGTTQVEHFDGLVTLVIPYESDPDLSVISYGRQLLKFSWATKRSELLLERDSPHNHFNDGKCDVTGRLWAGTYGVSRGEEKGPDDIAREKGTLYSFQTLEPRAHVRKVNISNGMTWSPDSKKMFYVDSFIRVIYAFDFDALDGELSNRQVLVDFNANPAYQEMGYPDGMTHDVDGKLWVACYDAGRVIRMDPETGQLLREVTFPATKITSCCFGGADYDDLYVTSAWRGLSNEQRKAQPLAGAVFKVTGLGTRGFQPYTFVPPVWRTE